MVGDQGELEWLADQQAGSRRLLNRWGLIGVYDEEFDFPPGEYDCLLPIVTCNGRSG